MAKVLLVEDDNNLREIYQARLMAEGYDIVAAQNGEEALVVAKQNKPDLIISDVMMPRISGFEMLDILRNTEGLKHTPVIMLTALGQAEDQKRADNLGADKYLVKSQVTLEDIVGAAKELLDKDGLAAGARDAAEAAGPTPPAAPEPSTPPVAVTTGAIPVTEPPAEPTPAPAAEPTAAAAPATPPVAPAEPMVPASVVPQPDTTVVVPPAPANPTPPVVTTVPLPEPPAEPAAAAAPAEPAVAPEPVAATPAPVITEPVTPPTDPAAEAPTVPVTPEVAPAPDPALETQAEAAVTDAASQTLEAEEKALQEQIASYAKEPGENPPAVDPAEAATDANNEAAIDEAVEELAESTSEPAPVEPPSVANAPEPASAPEAAPADPASTMPTTPEPPVAPVPETTSDNVNVAGKKVIAPINDLNSTSTKLDELLAKEAAQQPAQAVQPTPVVDGAPKPPQPGTNFDPNTAL